MTGFCPTKSHVELITTSLGQTFAARWRTRLRDNGLFDYLGSNITIGRLNSPLTEQEFENAWELSGMDELDVRIYPVLRILLLGATATFAPAWLDEIMLFKNWAVCSEVVARFYRAVRVIRRGEFGSHYLRFVEDTWKGVMPGHIEQAMFTDDFSILYEGPLTLEFMKQNNLPVFVY
jgi:hypothetical protein